MLGSSRPATLTEASWDNIQLSGPALDCWSASFFNFWSACKLVVCPAILWWYWRRFARFAIHSTLHVKTCPKDSSVCCLLCLTTTSSQCIYTLHVYTHVWGMSQFDFVFGFRGLLLTSSRLWWVRCDWKASSSCMPVYMYRQWVLTWSILLSPQTETVLCAWSHSLSWWAWHALMQHCSVVHLPGLDHRRETNAQNSLNFNSISALLKFHALDLFKW